MKPTAILVVVVLFVAQIAVASPVQNPSTQMVWLYRPVSDQSGLGLTLYMDGRKLANLGPGEFFGLQGQFGLHAFSWSNTPTVQQIAVPIQPNQQTYLEVIFKSSEPFLFINSVSAEKAVSEMGGLRSVPSSHTFDTSVIAVAKGQTVQTPPPAPPVPSPAPASVQNSAPKMPADSLSPAFVQNPPPAAMGNVLIDGTPLRMRNSRTISSADAKVGDTVDFEVLDEVRIGGLVVVPKGGLALGTVTEAEPKRTMGRGGKLNVNIDHVRLIDGEKVPLRAIKEGEGGGHVGAMTGAIVATSIVFFPAAPLFLFMHGKDITVPKGTEITAYINGDFTVDMARLSPSAPTIATVPVAAGSAMVTISSLPDGADITVDGKFVGNTPSTVRFASGDHAISVEKAGFKVWQRNVSTSDGSTLTITATLDKKP